MPLINEIAHRLPNQMRADCERLEPMIPQDLQPAFGVIRILQTCIDVEMIPPAGQLHAVVAEAFRLRTKLVKREVGPLAGEERDGACHVSGSPCDRIKTA